MIKSLAMSVGLVVFVCSVLFFPYYNGHSIQVANAQNDDQLFKDCRSKFLELANRMSEAMDRALYEDMRTEVHAILTEGFVLQSDCEPVKDRLAQDPAIQYQNEYFMERAKEFGIVPSEVFPERANMTNTTDVAQDLLLLPNGTVVNTTVPEAIQIPILNCETEEIC